jgi:rhamnose transport system permease protein
MTTASMPARDELTARLKSWLLTQESVLLLLTILTLIIMSLSTDKFLTSDNILTQVRLMVEIGLIALPMTYIIITGGIDLSVGSIVGLTAIMLGYAWETWELPLEQAILLAIFFGTAAGFMNGLFIVRLGVPPLIMTLATLTFYRGLAEGVSQGRSVRNYPEWFYTLGQGDTLGIPNQIFLFIVFTLIFAIILSRTTFGRSLYAIGNNELGTRFSGLPVDRNKLIIYSASGLMAALSGFIFVSRVTTTRSDMGTGWELDAIAAVVLGGTSIFGGSGSIWGTVIGLVLVRFLQNGLALNGVTSDATIIVIGTILIVATLINNYVQQRRAV